MRSDSRFRVALGSIVLLASSSSAGESPAPVHEARYCMGTMFDIIAYHPNRADAERAVAMALDEIARLEQALSHFRSDSELSKLLRDAPRGFVTVDPSLYDVIQEAIAFSRRSGGKFDVTIAPLLRAWKEAYARGRTPSAGEISQARRCVGYEKIEVGAPYRLRLHSDCVEIDLGGIGKGYAVDRAMAVLESAGIQHALVNAGGSSIGTRGAPPGRRGWPITLGTSKPGSRILLLRNRSMSTSQQALMPAGLEGGSFGEILDPLTAAPIRNRTAVTVVGPRATAADALSTTLLMVSVEEGERLLAQFTDVSAIWTSEDGALQAEYGGSRLEVSDSR
jgi:FAD:protein FMN transferase